MDIGQRIRALRDAQKLTQTAFSKHLGVPQGYLSGIETSAERALGMSTRQLLRFAHGLNVRAAALLEEGEFQAALDTLTRQDQAAQ